MGVVANQVAREPGYELLRSAGKSRRKPRGNKRSPKLADQVAAPIRVWQWALILGVEIAGALVVALVVVIAVLGRAALWFAGAGMWSSLLPFAASIVALLVFALLLFRLWLPVRSWMMSRVTILPATLAALAGVAAFWGAREDAFQREMSHLQGLVGGSAHAEKQTLAHQIYAAYRRSDLTQSQRILDRAQVYEPTIHEAAATFDVDAEVLVGIGATESSFYPRDSKDGGRGLFQITVPPKPAVDQALKALGVKQLDELNQRHNAFVAAATLRHYLAEMRGDLFLGLLAYNIGPSNGGLRSIMQQYGARDFVTIQPYLQNLPRDYPIRVLSNALAYRVWRTEGRLPRYEDGRNATRIQKIGIPGLHTPADAAPSLWRQGAAGPAQTPAKPAS